MTSPKAVTYLYALRVYAQAMFQAAMCAVWILAVMGFVMFAAVVMDKF